MLERRGYRVNACDLAALQAAPAARAD